MAAVTEAQINAATWIPDTMRARLGTWCNVRYKLVPHDRYVWRGRVVGFARFESAPPAFLVCDGKCEFPQVVALDEATF